MSLPTLSIDSRKERVALLATLAAFVLWIVMYEVREVQKAQNIRKIEQHLEGIAGRLAERVPPAEPRHESYPDVDFLHQDGVVYALHKPTNIEVQAETRFDALLKLAEVVEENTTMDEDGVPRTTQPDKTDSSEDDDGESEDDDGDEVEEVADEAA